MTTFVERFWAKVDVKGPDECWPWTGCSVGNGYGRVAAGFTLGGPKVWYAHRAAYTIGVGPIPTNSEIDHQCHTEDALCTAGVGCAHRKCVNPAHLTPVSHLENAFRRESRLGFCVNGHPKTAENRGPNGLSGSTKCKVCHRDRERARRAVS